ncbi:MAG: 6-phosphogluconate dehydrogenase [Pelagibacteraceae bacterium]|nr:6-phosphogluconate dehydrogenase [Pelagibacteraceae bacterium]OUV89482.1 MAG: 6-phosphogluconate dehydrogenase [Pelagibacteraceae bacterium TMED146]
MQTIAIIGTGLMGYPMSKNISKKFKLKAYNRTFERMKGLDQSGIIICKSIEQVCENSNIIISMLPDDKAVLETVKKVSKHIQSGSIFIDMSSTKVSTAVKCSKILKLLSVDFLDAPVSGGPEGAKSASLAIMVGGSEKIFSKVYKVLQTIGRPVLVGPNGCGQVAKLCNQIIVGVTIGAVAEAIILCEKNGVDPKKFITAVSGGFADGKILQNHGQRMIDKDFVARGKNITHLKDMNNILECASQKGIKLPISKLIQNMFKNLCDSGFENDDHSSLYKEISNLK